MVCNDYRAVLDYYGNIVHNSLIYTGIWHCLFTVDIFDLVVVRVKQNPMLAIRVAEI
jgi:hypothetical protein